jgi:hypothetical protein
MTRTRALAAWVGVLAAVGGAVGQGVRKAPPVAAGASDQPGGAEKAAEPKVGEWEARFPDGKLQKLTVLDDTLTLETAFGTLKIPAREVRRIEFGVRYTAADRRRIEQAIADVLAADAPSRERGKDVLVEVGLKAYPLVARAAKKGRTSPHLAQVLDKLRGMTPEDYGEVRDHDVVVAADESRLAGTLGPDALTVKVGDRERPLRWSDARVLVNGGSAAAEEKLEVVTLGQLGVHGLMQTHFEKVVGVRVTGMVGGGSVWGSGPYTNDSNLAAAAVHAGALQAGETAVIKIKVRADAGGYAGSTRNGVTTSNWGAYQGCYEILGKQKKN